MRLVAAERYWAIVAECHSYNASCKCSSVIAKPPVICSKQRAWAMLEGIFNWHYLQHTPPCLFSRTATRSFYLPQHNPTIRNINPLNEIAGRNCMSLYHYWASICSRAITIATLRLTVMGDISYGLFWVLSILSFGLICPKDEQVSGPVAVVVRHFCYAIGTTAYTVFAILCTPFGLFVTIYDTQSVILFFY